MAKRPKRTLHCSETCSSCADSYRVIGDRDAQIRDLTAKLGRAEKAQRELDLVIGELDALEVPTATGKPHERIATSGRVKWLGLRLKEAQEAQAS